MDQEKKGFEEWMNNLPGAGLGKDDLKQIWEASEPYKQHVAPNTEMAWGKFQNRIRQEEPETGKVISLNRRFSLWRIAAALAVLLVAAFLLEKMVGTSTPGAVYQAGDVVQAISLTDGSTVTLNKTSQLFLMNDFNASNRTVRLEGEGFFEVEKNKETPFIVQTELADIQVVGTSFNVRAIPGEHSLEVFVKTGKVRVKLSGSGQVFELTPGEKFAFDRTAKKPNKTVLETENDLAWKTRRLVFKNQPLSDVFQAMQRLYGIRLEAKDKALLSCKFTLTQKNGNAEEVMQAISAACPIKFEKTSASGYLVSGRCCQ
jgi:ferric-dicitrate binding protein FerR (iron transport regulator)